MQQVVLDAATRAKLPSLNELLEFRDEAGQILGHFLPVERSAAAGRQLSPHTNEEIEQLRRQTGGRPLAEIWKSLEPRS